MNRRKFLQTTAVGGGLTAIAGGLLANQAYARYRLREQMLADASPLLTNKAHTEFQSIPSKGREEIKMWFNGKILNGVRPFVDEVCSEIFRTRLQSLSTVEEQQQLLAVSFYGKIATENEIINRVDTIAREVVQEIDTNWGGCCKEIASSWNVHIREYSEELDFDEFGERINQIINEEMNQALEMARVEAQDPTLVGTFGDIGEDAVLILPMSKYRINLTFGELEYNPLAVPAFIFRALHHVFDYVIGLLFDPRDDLQSAVSARVALMGNRIGTEFESAVREQLPVIHGWQEQTVAVAAEQYADSVVDLL